MPKKSEGRGTSPAYAYALKALRRNRKAVYAGAARRAAALGLSLPPIVWGRAMKELGIRGSSASSRRRRRKR